MQARDEAEKGLTQAHRLVALKGRRGQVGRDGVTTVPFTVQSRESKVK